MNDGITTLAGIAVPSTDPIFLSIVALHVPLGLLAAVAGAIAIAQPETCRPPPPSRNGLLLVGDGRLRHSHRFELDPLD